MNARAAARRPSTTVVASGLTHVELTWVEKRIEHWIRFGRIAEEKVLDRRRRIVSFRPGGVFAFVPKSFDAQRTKAKTPPGGKLTIRRRRSRIFSSAIRPKRIQCSIRFSSQVSSTCVKPDAATVVDGLRAAAPAFIAGLRLCREIRA